MEINTHAWNLKKGNAKQHHAESFYFPLSVFDYVIAASGDIGIYARVCSAMRCVLLYTMSRRRCGAGRLISSLLCSHILRRRTMDQQRVKNKKRYSSRVAH